ncbi:MAG: hypothetical protein IKD06_03720 [Clostridia bacterium]|nr:hypothetical protein [Clostridia bacterium]
MLAFIDSVLAVVDSPWATAFLAIVGLATPFMAVGKWVLSRTEFEKKRRQNRLIKICAGTNKGQLPRDRLSACTLRLYGDAVKKGLASVDAAYFKKTVFTQEAAEYAPTKAEEMLLHFPIATNPRWLLSRNPDFNMNLTLLRDQADFEEDLQKAQPFLKRFGVEKITDFLIANSKEVYGQEEPKIWNAQTFDITRVIPRENGQVDLQFVRSDYFHYINYFYVCHKELENGIREKKAHQSLRAFDARRNFNIEEIVSGNETELSVSAPVGVVAFALLKNCHGGYSTFIQKRGKAVAEWADLYSICPAGTFQPLDQFDMVSTRKQFSFEYTILREFLEEHFDLPETEQTDETHVDPYDIFRQKINEEDLQAPGEVILDEADLEQLRRGCFTGNDKLKIIRTGLMIDMISLKPEVTAILLIDDEHVCDRLRALMKRDHWEGHFREKEINREFFDFLADTLCVESFTSSGAVALAEGLHYWRTQLNGKLD